MLHMCTQTRKFTCRSYNVLDAKAAPRPATWAFRRFLTKWVKVTSAVRLDADVVVPQPNKTPRLTRDGFWKGEIRKKEREKERKKKKLGGRRRNEEEE